MGAFNLFFIKNIFYGKVYLRLFLFSFDEIQTFGRNVLKKEQYQSRKSPGPAFFQKISPCTLEFCLKNSARLTLKKHAFKETTKILTLTFLLTTPETVDVTFLSTARIGLQH